MNWTNVIPAKAGTHSIRLISKVDTRQNNSGMTFPPHPEQ